MSMNMGEGLICKVCVNTDFALAFDPSRWNHDGPDSKVLYYGRAEVVHQPSITSLRGSALQGCPICLFFLEVLQQPLRLQEPEPWGRFEASDSKKKKKKARRAFDAARSHEEKLGPCLVWGIIVEDIHQDYAPHNGAVSGFRYGPRNSTVALGVTASDSSPENVGTRNLLNHTDTGLCRDWLKQCQSKHRSCPPIFESNLPTRLIDVGEPKNGVAPRLVETRGQTGQYVTLSHCWGKSKPPSTTKANLSSHLISMPLNLMPKTFRDALNIVHLLGYRYIWIDSYCIVQDDDADWQRECASMAAVYSNCVFTIAAPFANDCYAGFSRGLHPIPAEIWCEIPVFWPGATNPDPIRVFYPYNWKNGRVDWDDSPLAERAWVLQEHLLSPRWLYFGRDSLYFECCTAQFDEHLRVALNLSSVRVGTHLHASKDIMEFKTYGEGLSKWYSMIYTYSNLCLTHGSDRLPALSGIASRFAAKLDDEYIAGLWRKDVVFGMIFRVSEENETLRSLNPASITGPSWSWYSCDRRVQTRVSLYTRYTVDYVGGTHNRTFFNAPDCFGPLIEVLSISATLLGQNSFGAVRDAKLTVTGRLQCMWCSDGQIHLNEDGEVIGELSADHPNIFGGRRIATVLMLPIAICGNWVDGRHNERSWHALALVEVMSEPKTYRRIGMIHEATDKNYGAANSDDSSRWKVWTCLFAPELQKLHLI